MKRNPFRKTQFYNAWMNINGPFYSIRENLEWYKENGRNHGDLVIAEESITLVIKDFIRSLLSSSRHEFIEELRSKIEKMKTHADGSDCEECKKPSFICHYDVAISDALELLK